MELDQKLRYAMFAFTAATLVMGALGLHPAVHIRALDFSGSND